MNRGRRAGVVAAVVVLTVGTAQVATAGTDTHPRPAVSAAERAARAVVPGVVYVQSQLPNGGIEGGTGMVLTPEGEVLTNYHLVHDALTIGIFDLGDHRIHHAHLVGADPRGDIAVVSIEGAHHLSTVAIATDPAYIGQPVVAVGNGGGKLGEHPGRITATGQQLTAGEADGSRPETIYDLLETDARLTPGDSGGPLVATGGTDFGKVVGMDTAGLFVHNSTGTRPLAGFAIPITHALEVAADIERGAHPGAEA